MLAHTLHWPAIAMYVTAGSRTHQVPKSTGRKLRPEDGFRHAAACIGILLSTLITFHLRAEEGSNKSMTYPETRRVDHTDTYHGTVVADPYRWLENDVRENSEVAEWVKSQAEFARSYLDQLPSREAMRVRLTKLWNYPRYSQPFHRGDRYFFFKNDGLQNQAVLYTMEGLDGEPRVLLDPNTWSEDGTVSLGGLTISHNGRFLAYGVVKSGSDWRSWKVRNIDSGEDLAEELLWTKAGGVSWTLDDAGFFYSRYPQPKEGEEFQAHNLNEKVYYHRLGSPQDLDVLTFERPDEPEWNIGATVSDDGRYVIYTVSKGTNRKYRVFFRDLSEPYSIVRPLIDTFDYEYAFLGNDGPRFYFRTDHHAPRKRVVAIDVEHARDDVGELITHEILGQAKETLSGISLVSNVFIAHYLQDAHSVVRLYATSGKHIRDVSLPGIGSAGGFGGRRSDTETFYSFSNYATPASVYRYNLLTGESLLFRRSEVDCNPENFVVRQVFYESKDGTRVPMFLAHKKDLQFDGKRPTLLYGYGGFSIPLTPHFSVSLLHWMEMGGVYAVANIRGGGEYGEEWHNAGIKLKKQNVFDDFIAAAEWLTKNDITRPDRLAISGSSNGGLLVGACMLQRPELFGACLPGVGVMDMLRFHKFTAGRYWVDDYGSSDDPEEFRALRAYSPYHNVGADTAYPPTMITTADTDDRVVPMHSFKFGAAMQHAQQGANPIILRVETRAGHGGGTPTAKIIEQVVDRHAFLSHHLKMPDEE